MTSSLPPTRPDAFLSEMPWLRRLALRLTGDPHDADDLAQQAWLQASRGRRPKGAVRGWLAAIIGNLHRSADRMTRRRARREQQATAPDPDPSPVEICAQLDAHRSLLAAVGELAEPYRSSIVQHYLYGQTVRAIAARAGVPERTVETRLRRAREQLRGRLDRELGSRGAWLALLGPLPAVRPPAVPPDATDPLPAAVGASATLAVTTKILTTVLCLAATAAATLTVWFWPDAAPPTTSTSAGEPTGRATVERVSSTTVEAPRELARAAVPASRTAAAPPPSPTATAARLRILCIDPAGVPVPGLALHRQDGEGNAAPLGVSDADGVITTLANDGQPELTSEHPGNDGWQLVLRPELSATGWDHDESLPLRFAVVARSVALAGTVRSAVRDRLRGVKVELVLPADWQSRIPHVLNSGVVPKWSAVPDADDRFAMTAPSVPGAQLHVTATAHQQLSMPLPASDRYDLDLVLRPVTRNWTLAGIVVDAGGATMAKMRVVSSLGSTTTGGDGAFRLEVEGDAPPARLHAIGKGWQPATIDVPGAPEGSREIAGLRLTLTRPSLTIEGRVLDVDGQPLASARVFYEHGSTLGWSGDFPVAAERSAAGTDLLWHHAITDEDGRFELGGLLDRSYVLHAASPRGTLEVQSAMPVRAGSDDVELRLDASRQRDPVHGRLVDSLGRPVARARIGIDRIGHALHDREGRSYVSSIRGASVQTDEQGRFVLEGLPADHDVNVTFAASGFTNGTHELAAGRSPGTLELVIHRECTILVDLRDPDQGDAISFEDKDRTALQVRRVTTEVHYMERRSKLVDGRVTVQVPGNAVTAVLWRNGERVSSTTLSLQDGDDQTLRF